MEKKIRMGVVGLGSRGHYMIPDTLLPLEGVEVVGICDLYEDRLQAAAALIEEKQGAKPYMTTDYKQLFREAGLDAVYVATSWQTHIRIAIDALRAGIATAMEVGCAYNMQELYELIRAEEETGTPFMFMENCCFNETELLATAMARAGKFGRIVYCHGAYAHDLRSEVAGGHINRHYRLDNYQRRNTENYPTHEAGPIARLLNINRGNRFVSLVSVASSSHGMEQFLADHPDYVEKDPTLRDAEWHQGDVVNTIITCADGTVVTLRLDTMLPRSYSREFTVRGTKGMYEQATNSVFFDGDTDYFDTTQYYRGVIDNAKAYVDEFMPQVWKDMTDDARLHGHGGMDDIMFRVFFDRLRKGEPMPIDVYDAATWLCISTLAEQSIAQGGAPQAFPDFTNGAWLTRKSEDVIPLG